MTRSSLEFAQFSNAIAVIAGDPGHRGTAQIHAIMVGPDALLIPLDQHPVRARAPRLDPAISLERRQDTRSLGHAQHRRAPVRQSAQEARCKASAGTCKQSVVSWRDARAGLKIGGGCPPTSRFLGA